MSSPRVRRTMVSTPASSSVFWKARISVSPLRSKRVPGKGLNGIRLTLAACEACARRQNLRISAASSRACSGWSFTPFISVYSKVIESILVSRM